jgi:UDP-N-acetylglucosamine 2-epimerase (non-hydrolysing)
MAIVQGDTSSALGGARAALVRGVPLAHVEAGLRTHDHQHPWPEEDFRVEIDAIADMLFAPTESNAAHLRAENVRGQILVTGNPGIDALLARPHRRPFRFLRSSKRPSLLVTCHRRENWGEGIAQLSTALIRLAGGGRAKIDYVLHPNPRVSEQAFGLLGQQRGIRLLPPLSSHAMIEAMRRADLLLSDSGGMQEEAAAIGLPMLILREKTERGESIDSGNAVRVGTDPELIEAWVDRFRQEPALRARMACPALVFGDGHAAARIAAHCQAYLAQSAVPARQIA